MAAPTAPGGQPATGRAAAPGQGTGQPLTRGGLSQAPSSFSSFGRGSQTGGAPVGFGGTVAGGIVGVQSKSKEKSIRIYNGRTHYNEWQFVFIPQAGQPGGRGQPGQPGVPQPGGPLRGGPQRGNPRGGPAGGNPPTYPPPGGRPTTPITPQRPGGPG